MPKKHSFDYDLIVIGSGAGGSTAASLAARESKKVAIVEADTLGGDSPNWSDIPLHAMLVAAEHYDNARLSTRFGLRTSTISYNYPSLHAWKDLAIGRTGTASNRKFYENQGIDVYLGRAHFLTPNEISVNRRHLSASNFLIATGSHWEVPAVAGLASVPYLTPRTLLQQMRPPKSIYIIGGNTAGIEVAQFMATFGTKVYISEPSSRLLPQFDEEAGELLERLLLERKGVTSLTQSRTMAISKDGLGYKVTYARGGAEKSVKVDAILLAANRLPTVDLGLENAHVSYTPAGITVNNQLQTSAKHIYAAGDVLNASKNTQTAMMESRIVANNLLRKNKLAPEYDTIPNVVYSYPQIASTGLTADDCLRRDLPINTAFAPLGIIARSNTADFRDGFVKLITDKKGTLLGGTIMAPGAADIVAELSLAIRYNLTAGDLAATPHAFLSWSEAVRVAASKLG